MANVLKKTLWTYFLSIFLNGSLAVYKSKTISINPIPAARWSVDVLKEKISVSNLKQIETGFDLDENEIKKFKLWPNGVIPYYIDDISFDKVLRDRIRSFLDVTSGLTGLHFRELHTPPKDDKTRWVFFVNRLGTLGCADHSTLNFTNEGIQRVILGYNCMSEEGELPEAVLSVVGVPSQHNAPDRDDFIQVVPENIIPAKKYLFDKLGDNEWLFHDLNYDFNSAGHFSYHKHTNNGLATIRPKVEKHIDILVGENHGFSYTDILKIHMLYNYISKKKTNIHAPECNKLFVPGNNFDRFKPDTPDEVPPRPKPRQYLGLPQLPNDKINIPNDANGDKASDDASSYEGDGNKKDNKSKVKIGNKESDKDEIEIDGENYKDNAKDKGIEKTKNGMGIKSLKKIDPLTQLSDYDTDQKREIEKEKRGRWKNRFVKN